MRHAHRQQNIMALMVHFSVCTFLRLGGETRHGDRSRQSMRHVLLRSCARIHGCTREWMLCTKARQSDARRCLECFQSLHGSLRTPRLRNLVFLDKAQDCGTSRSVKCGEMGSAARKNLPRKSAAFSGLEKIAAGDASIKMGGYTII